MIKLSKKVIGAFVALILVLAVIISSIMIFTSGGKYNKNKYNNTTVTTEGGSKQKDANLNEISLTEDNGAININLHFISGSSLEETTPCKVPEYKVEFLEAPLRLQITLKDMVYWDYMVQGVPDDETFLINGMFQMSPYNNNTDTTLYFSLSKSVKFKVLEQDNLLTISLKPDKKDKQEDGWYLACDMYYEYQTGEKTDYGFTPVLCSDKISVIMMSQRFKNENQAKNERDKLLTSSLEGVEIRLISLKAGELPTYSESSSTHALLGESILSIDGAKTTLPLFYSDARFLAWNPDGSGALFAKTEDGQEKLYIADKNGARHLLTETGFSTVIKPFFSSDGTRLVFVDQSENTTVVTAIDVQSGKVTVINKEENAFGEIIMGVALNETGTKLYCLSGSEAYSIKVYDFATDKITTLKDNILLESDLYYHNGYLYYCDVVDEYEAVVRLNITSGQQELLHKGAQFTISPDGTKLALIVEHYETAVCDLRVVDLENNAWDTVMEDVVTTEFFFGFDSKQLYFTVETGDDEFYYQIMCYDVEKMKCVSKAQAINSVFFPSNKPNEIIISVMFNDETGSHHATYIADFDKMVVGENAEQGE